MISRSPQADNRFTRHAPGDTMDSISDYLKHDYAHCNQLYYAACERALADADTGAASAMEAFVAAIERHMRIEDQIVFVAFEAAMERGQSLTNLLRLEHIQIRATLERMTKALAAAHKQAFLMHADTLRLLLQQHAQKENFHVLPQVAKVLATWEAELLKTIARFEQHAA
jgi:hemerythrin-like domain-containing protein